MSDLNPSTSARFVVKPSRVLAWALFLVSALAIAALWTLDLPLAVRAVAGIAVLATGIFHTRTLWAGQSRWMPNGHEFELLPDGNCRWKNIQGNWLDAEILGSSFVSSWMTLLNLKTDARRSISIAILPDTLAQEDFRRLRIWLRWRASGAGRGAIHNPDNTPTRS